MKKKLAIVPDSIGMRIVRRVHDADDGSCAYLRKDGSPCKSPVAAMHACVSHLRQIGGHLWVFDVNEPDWAMRKGDRLSFCRACAEIKTKKTALALCPIRRNDPEAPCPTSTDLPMRLQYRFAQEERRNVAIDGSEVNAPCVGPFALSQVQPDAEGRTWRVYHIPSRSPVALLDSKFAGFSLMRKICSAGVELDFRDPMKMHHDTRSRIDSAVRYLRKGNCVRVPGGVLTWAPRKHMRPWRSLEWNLRDRKGSAECWGPFVFLPTEQGIKLLNLGEHYAMPAVFHAPSHERAVAFARAVAAMDLEWCESHSSTKPRYAVETREGAERALAAFPDVVCLDGHLATKKPAARCAPGEKVLISVRVSLT